MPIQRVTYRAFTLIELLIVVAIMAVIAAVAVPALLGRLQSEEREQEERVPMLQAPPTVTATTRDGSSARAPRIESSQVKVRLTAAPVVDGLRVHTRYVASFSGRFVVQNIDESADTVTLSFPFPPGMTEARGVSLNVESADGELREPDNVRYDATGVHWTSAVAPAARATVVVTYEAVGRDQFQYDVAGRGRTGSIRFEVALADTARATIPATALQPSTMTGETIVWRFDNLISSRPIIVDLPAGASPLGRLINLFQLAALAVLLFGAGFWYLNEKRRPGALDDFRWGHFLLLALNYSLFFGVFAVIAYRLGALVAAPVAALISLPFLTLHIARIADLRFALGSILPLALLTLGTVVGAVYVEEYRPFVLLGTAVVMVGYLTMTYRGWSNGRHGYRDEVSQRQQLAAARRGSRCALSGLMKHLDELRTTLRAGRRSLKACPPGFDLSRSRLSTALTRAEAVAERAELLGKVESVPRRQGDPLPVTKEEAEKLEATCNEQNELVEPARVELQRAQLELDAQVEEAKRKLAQDADAMEGSMQNAWAILGEAEIALKEGPGRDADSAQEAADRAFSLLQRTLEHAQALRIQAAGTADVSLKELSVRANHFGGLIEKERRELERAMETLRHMQQDLLEQELCRTRSEETEHCSACGYAGDPSTPFCPGCGTPRPHTIDCGGCGETFRVPVQLVRRKWTSVSLHCEGCGTQLQGTRKLA